jgi:hypothetical protein
LIVVFGVLDWEEKIVSTEESKDPQTFIVVGSQDFATRPEVFATLLEQAKKSGAQIPDLAGNVTLALLVEEA